MSVPRGEKKTPGLSRKVFLRWAGVVLVVDQLAKLLILSRLRPGETYPLVPRLFHLTLVQNQGIAFGLFHDSGTLLFLVITLSLAVLVFIGFRTPPSRPRTHVGLGLILGGALGNWVDRVRAGAVIDFLDFHIWPVFNLADTAISLGVALLFWEFVTASKHAA